MTHLLNRSVVLESLTKPRPGQHQHALAKYSRATDPRLDLLVNFIQDYKLKITMNQYINDIGCLIHKKIAFIVERANNNESLLSTIKMGYIEKHVLKTLPSDIL
jgi:hypothetical protein